MKRMIQILSLGLLLSVSTVALAKGGHDRNHRDGYSDGQYRHASQNVRYKHHRQHSKHHRHGDRRHVKNNRHTRRYSHHGRYCYDWHPRGYVESRPHHGYSSSGLVMVYQPSEGLYLGVGY